MGRYVSEWHLSRYVDVGVPWYALSSLGRRVLLSASLPAGLARTLSLSVSALPSLLLPSSACKNIVHRSQRSGLVRPGLACIHPSGLPCVRR